jgi:tetratricopeptide (TPR) repeat protein
MSFINEALKKAQKDRDTHYLKYRGFLAAKGKGGGPFGGKTFLYSLSSLLFILLVFITYSWLNSSNGRVRSTTDSKAPALTTQEVSITDPKSNYDKARQYYRIGRLEDAKKLYEEILRLDPGYVNALNNLSVIYMHDKEYPVARNYLEKAIRLKPGYVDPYYNMACLHAIKGDLKESMIYLEKAVFLEPSVKDWAQKDTDLANLRQLPEFKEMILSERGDQENRAKKIRPVRQ